MDDDTAEKWRLADEEVRKNLPPGVKLARSLRNSVPMKDYFNSIAWSPDGQMLASSSMEDNTIGLWDVQIDKCVRTLNGHKSGVYNVAFDPTGRILASGSKDNIELWDPRSGRLLRTLKGHKKNLWSNALAFDPTGKILASARGDDTIMLWDPRSGRLLRTLKGHKKNVHTVAFNPAGNILASGSGDDTIMLWDPTSGRLLHMLEGHKGGVNTVAFNPAGNILASGSDDKTIMLWDPTSGRLLRTLEEHTGPVYGISFSLDGSMMASKGYDQTVRLWNTHTDVCIGILSEPTGGFPCIPVFSPSLPLLATVGSDPHASKKDIVIHIYELDFSLLLGQMAEPNAHYVNAKVVLVGDTGVGKTGLSLVLNNQSFEATDSTPGRRVWTFDSQEIKIGSNITQTRETLLWDLAGQPGYRVIHQLHLNEVAVALVVFDARSETDPLAGVRHWERALRLAQQRQGSSSVPLKKFLVSARNDRGGVSISDERSQSILKEFGFDGYFKTSAKEGWQVKELREAIEKAIPWEDLPKVSSPQLFADIKSFLLEVKKTGRLLTPADELYNEMIQLQVDVQVKDLTSIGRFLKKFFHQQPEVEKKQTILRDQFDTCVGRLENRDLIRRLTFGDYVLLQPELLDAYASAIVITAKEEPDGLGSIAEEITLAGRFFVPEEQRVRDSGQEQLLLHATVEELVRYDLALRENADDGRYLVFPSQFNRDYEDAPEPKGKTLGITFDGPVQSLYSTLVVRLGHSGLFTTGREEMWRNAAVFTAKAGGRCGLFLQEFAEARGRLILFFNEHASIETRFHFEEFVMSHAKRRALDGTVELVRFFVCPDCGDPVPDNYVKRLRDKGKKIFDCPCGGTVSLTEPKEQIHFRSEVETMEKSADWQRDFEAFVMSAKGETSTRSFQEWAGGDRVTLAIVFTDIVGSTELGVKLGDETMNKVRLVHFAQSQRLIREFNGREIKTIGDSFMVAFKSVDTALEYARALQKHTGHPNIQVRAGIHIGSMHVEAVDVFGGTVNFAARVVGAIKGAEIWLSDRAKEDIDQLGAAKHKQLSWERHDDIAMKGFPGMFTLWSVK